MWNWKLHRRPCGALLMPVQHWYVCVITFQNHSCQKGVLANRDSDGNESVTKQSFNEQNNKQQNNNRKANFLFLFKLNAVGACFV